jgi:PAS domain S-box-containing protein
MVSAAANDAIIIMSRTGTIAVWNQAAQRIFGYSEQEAQGKKLGELIVPEGYRIEFEDMFNHLGSDGLESVSSTPTDLPGLRKDGTQIVTEYSISSVTINGRWHAIYIVRDITARKQAEDEILERTGALEMLSAKMLSGDEMEKKKLAFGLHEGLAQTLITIKMRIEHKLAHLARARHGTSRWHRSFRCCKARSMTSRQLQPVCGPRAWTISACCRRSAGSAANLNACIRQSGSRRRFQCRKTTCLHR